MGKNIKMFDLSNKENKISKGLRDGSLKPKEIPLQIRSLIFSRSSGVKNNILENKTDIFKNRQTDEMAYQFYTNIKKMSYLEGFEIGKDGTYSMSAPIFKEMTDENYDSIQGINKICVLQKYVNMDFIPTVKNDFDSNGDVFLLSSGDEKITKPRTISRGGRKTTGRTTDDYGHKHKYKVDKFGNGWTTEAVHPKNKKVRHRHKIVNWTIQTESSNCYPNCKELGVRGAPPHSHEFEKTMSINKTDRKKEVAKNMIEAAEDGTNMQMAPSVSFPQQRGRTQTPQRTTMSSNTSTSRGGGGSGGGSTCAGRGGGSGGG